MLDFTIRLGIYVHSCSLLILMRTFLNFVHHNKKQTGGGEMLLSTKVAGMWSLDMILSTLHSQCISFYMERIVVYNSFLYEAAYNGRLFCFVFTSFASAVNPAVTFWKYKYTVGISSTPG